LTTILKTISKLIIFYAKKQKSPKPFFSNYKSEKI